MTSGLSIKQTRLLTPVKWLMIVVILSALVATGYYGYRWFMNGEVPPFAIVRASSFGRPHIDETEISPGAINAYTVAASKPRFISIPSIGVNDARVYPVAVTKNNSLGAPHNIHDAGWYEKSALPGSGFGAVLIDGYTMGNNKAGILHHLDRLAVGSRISLQRGDGKVLHYKVVSNKTMSIQQAIPDGMRAMMVSADSNKEGLNIMSFAGTYIPRLGQFDQRVMVRAVIE